MTATADRGYSFGSWSSGGSSTGINPLSFTIWGNTSYTLTFNVISYQVNLDGNSGTLTLPSGWSYTSTTHEKGYKSFAYGTAKATVLTGVSASRTGYTLSTWSSEYDTVVDSNTQEYIAQWTPNTYNITYSSNVTDYTNPNPSTFTYNVTLTLQNASKANYDFNGWYLNGNKVTQITANTQPNNITLTASFSPKQYKITYNHCDGNETITEDYYTYNPDNSYGLITITRAHCTFDGWYTAASGGTKITEISAGSNADVVLYAHWVGVRYTISFDYGTLPANSDGTTGTITNRSTTSLSATYDPTNQGDGNITLPTPDTQNSEYAFYGWYTERTDSVTGVGTRIPGGSSYNGGYTSHPLYAVYVTTQVTVTPGFNGGGDTTGLITDIIKQTKPGTSVSFVLWKDSQNQNIVPRRDGYQFHYWCEIQSGSTDPSKQHAAGSTYTVTTSAVGTQTFSANITKNLYAIWEDSYKVTITYNANSGTWPNTAPAPYIDDSTTANRYVPVTQFPPADVPTPPVIGALFIGWDTNPNKTGSATYTADGVRSILVGTGTGAIPYDSTRNIAITLYAVWSDRMDVTFKGNNPSQGTLKIIDGDVVKIDEDLVLTTGVDGKLTRLPTATLNGYFFNDWWDAANGGTKITTSTFFDADTDVYAHWIHQHHISFSGNGIPFPSTVLVTNASETLDELPPLPTSQDYFIIGWYTTPFEGGTEVTTSYQFSGDTTVYARWKAIYRITFDANGGTLHGDALDEQNGIRTNEDYVIPPNDYPTATREGYTLQPSSYSGTDGTQWWFSANQSVEIKRDHKYTDNATLVAKWVARTFTITFDANGGAMAWTDTFWPNVTYNKPYNYQAATPTVSRGNFPIPAVYYETETTKYSFQGWSFQQSQQGKGIANVTANDPFTDLTHTTLYAVWWVGDKVVIFNPLGGSVAPERSVTNADGTLSFYPVPTRTGYSFIGWYNWPVYYTNLSVYDSTTAQLAYENAVGEGAVPIQSTLLVSTFDTTQIKQFVYDDGTWRDVSGRVYTTIYYTTEETIELTDGQSSILNDIWRQSNSDSGWVPQENGSSSTYPSAGYTFDTLAELRNYTAIPNNNDIGIVDQDVVRFTFKFIIPDGLTIVIKRKNENNDRTYTWNADSTAIGGSWTDTTNDWDAVVLPNHIFNNETNTLYAHWTPTPPPSTLSNTCYIERRLGKYSDDTVRLYLPNITSIDDTISSSLTQLDTVMFGYENKFLSDLGTSRRFTVGVQRVNPRDYNDYSEDPNNWSNGKWYNAFINFTNYWQNNGRDPATGSMVGGFKFHFIPMAQSDEDDRVDFSELYPVIDKNVFLTGVVETSFKDQLLEFTMNLAVGQMTSDTNSTGYEVRFYYDSNRDPAMMQRRLYPEGLDYILPNKPIDWTAPEGKMFSHWNVIGGDGSAQPYAAGSTIPYDVARYAICEGVWADTQACIVVTNEGASWIGNANDGLFSWNSDTNILTVNDNIIADITMVGGGGAGSGGQSAPEEIHIDGAEWDAVANAVAGIWTAMTGGKSMIFKTNYYSGGAGGAGQVDTVSLRLNRTDRLKCVVGKGGAIGLPGIPSWSDLVFTNYYIGEGNPGKATEVILLREGKTQVTYSASGGAGGKLDGKPGLEYQSGGSGGNNNNKQTNGQTAFQGAKGIPGVSGEDYDVDWDISSLGPSISGLIVPNSGKKRQHYFGGAGGGASALCNSYKVGNQYLETYTNYEDPDTHIKYFRSVGGNGVTNGNTAAAPEGQDGGPKYGGGGGSGTSGDGDLFHMVHWPTSGANGIIIMQFRLRI